MLFLKTLPLLSLSLFSLALAAPQNDDHDHEIPKTCTASLFTSIFVTYVPSTVTQVATIPHSCYTYLEATSQSDNSFCGTTFNSATCTPAPSCTTVQTIQIPCHDPCCPTTTTLQTPGGCISCQVGCVTSTTLVTSSGCPPVTTKYW